MPHLVTLRAQLAGLAFELAAIKLKLLLRKANFNPGQLRDELGRWTTEGGGSDRPQPAQGRRGSIRINVGGRLLEATPGQAARFAVAEPRAREAMRRVRDLDPGWRPAPSAIETIEGAIARANANTREAEARLAEVLPRGFGTYENYVTFGQSVRDGLRAAGYRDVEPLIRGSAVTGENFRTREPFDASRRSDYDIALVSPSLMQRAIDLGIPLRGRGTRTEPIRGARLDELGLGSLRNMVREQEGGPVSFMIYSSRHAVTRRGPSRPILGK
jgi:hypothetical protein